MCLPYLSIEGYISDKEDDDPNEEADETRARKGCLATIIDYQHHKVYTGNDFELPIVWSKEMDTDVPVEENDTDSLSGTVSIE